jgi:hypothetical protein
MKDGLPQLAAFQQALAQAAQGPENTRDALNELKACAERSLQYLTEGNTPQAQRYLEQAFTAMMHAFHFLHVDVNQVIKRQQAAQQDTAKALERVIWVFSDHAELRVGGEVRGTIPLYTPEDYAELRHIAQLFACRIEHADHVQLGLFQAMLAPKPE